MADCKEREQAIITKLKAATNVKIYATASATDAELINKIYSVDHACPSIVSGAFVLSDEANKDKDYPCFWMNRNTFKIIRIIRGEKISDQALKAEIIFKYGTDQNEYSIKDVQLIIENDDILYLPDLQHVYPPKGFAVLLEQADMTVKQFQSYLIENMLHQFLWKYGLKADVKLAENVDYTIFYQQFQGPDNPDSPIWNDTKATINPGFKRKSINFELWIMSMDTSKYIRGTYYFKIYAYEKIDLKEISIANQIFKARSLHDPYQDVINKFKAVALANAKTTISNLIAENHWIYDATYPEFNWNNGADFCKTINDNVDSQVKIFIKNHEANEEISELNVTYTIEANQGVNTFKNTGNFPVEIKPFIRYNLQGIKFRYTEYQAKSVHDTYRDALNAITDEIRNAVVAEFEKEERITSSDFILSTADEDTIITQDKTIIVTIKASANSEWLSGAETFELNINQFVLIKPFRQFKLINSLQEEIDLQDLNLVIGSSVNDLGISYKNNFLQIGNDFIFTQKSNVLNIINFKLTFPGPDAYDGYYDFIKFLTPNLNNNEPLILTYRIFYKNDDYNKNYKCQIFFKGITKTELNEFNNLEVQVSFERTSNWKNFVVNLFTFESNILELDNKGQVPAPAIIKILGEAKNPHFTLKDTDNNVLAESLILHQLGKNETLTIDSTLANQKIIWEKADKTEENIFNKQDFTKETFIFIPPGKTRLEYKIETTEKVQIDVSFEEQFISI